jgi:catechol 2,3-dioxygenase-like lactoylglutathione lyase family enzyme
MNDYISGIQQIGIGVANTRECLLLYKQLFGMDTLVFDDVSEASLMKQYTGGTIYKRHALLTLNMQGGGGFELWQFKNRQPVAPLTLPKYGDVGIYAAKLKCSNVQKAFNKFSQEKDIQLSSLQTDIKGDPHFYITDQHKNVFNIVLIKDWFREKENVLGGVAGAVIGVSDMNKAVAFYTTLLYGSEIVYDYISSCDSGPGIEGQSYRRVLLQKRPSAKGAFGKLLGSVEIELVQSLDRTPEKIYANRFWGDCGFIHLCFDVFDMCGLKMFAEENGYRFTVDSVDSFEMDKSTGRFCYMEDPDGTLVELVETHKVPILKYFGLYLNLKKRDLKKPLPDWMIKLLAFNRVK